MRKLLSLVAILAISAPANVWAQPQDGIRDSKEDNFTEISLDSNSCRTESSSGPFADHAQLGMILAAIGVATMMAYYNPEEFKNILEGLGTIASYGNLAIKLRKSIEGLQCIMIGERQDVLETARSSAKSLASISKKSGFKGKYLKGVTKVFVKGSKVSDAESSSTKIMTALDAGSALVCMAGPEGYKAQAGLIACMAKTFLSLSKLQGKPNIENGILLMGRAGNAVECVFDQRSDNLRLSDTLGLISDSLVTASKTIKNRKSFLDFYSELSDAAKSRIDQSIRGWLAKFLNETKGMSFRN